MRVFFIALLVSGVIAAGSIYALDAAQRASGVVFTTEGARINPAWTGT